MSKVGEESLRAAFNYYDSNGNGRISHSELKSVLDQMGLALTEEQVKQAIAQYDENKDGEWEYNEFYNFYINTVENAGKNVSQEQEIKGVFALLDSDKDGKIDTEEIKAFNKQMGSPMTDEQIKDLISIYDKNNSGAMEFDEFTEFYKDSKKAQS